MRGKGSKKKAMGMKKKPMGMKKKPVKKNGMRKMR
tara:strand:+ start:663 stop:767 length:105 start_codon:yes stop_codon:yes gene_type:complete